MPHTILPSIAARELDVSREQVFLWAERGLLNSKTGHHGTRIYVDARWSEFKATWEAEDVPSDLNGHSVQTAYKTSHEVQARRQQAYALTDKGLSSEEVAERLGISRTTVYEYLRKRHIYEA